MRLGGTERGVSGASHLIEDAVAVALLLAAMGFAAAALGRGFALYTVATVVVSLRGWCGRVCRVFTPPSLQE